jgi:glyoxylase-like metal-dependent hydrolase (beta-lactamase superfamily II)
MTMKLVPIIEPYLWLVEGEDRGRFPFAHAFLVRDDVTALIDTGPGFVRLGMLKQTSPPDLIMATHSHIDHTAGNWLFPDTPLWGPQESFDWLGRLDALAPRVVSPELAFTWQQYARRITGMRDRPPTDAYEDGHRFSFGHITLEAIHCPGHCADFYCLWEPTHGVLLAGDIDFTSFGPWYGNPESDLDHFEESINNVWALRPRIVVSSHLGIVTDDIDAHFEDYLAIFGRREDRLLAFLGEQSRTFDEIVDEALIYRSHRRDPGILRYFEAEMINKHLARLEARGQVRQIGNRYAIVSP